MSRSPRKPIPLFSTLVRLRCPHCGTGSVLESHFHIRERCPSCNLRFRRGDEAYFSGALFILYFLAAGGTALLFLLSLLVFWPAVPWTFLGVALPAIVVTLVIALLPVSRVIFLTLDVRMRPVSPEELGPVSDPAGVRV